jgi:hypothetical protein
MQFIIFVIDDLSGSGSADEMAAIDAFNEKLKRNGHWIHAGGLAFPDKAEVIDNRGNAQLSNKIALFNGPENYSGFWLISAEDYEAARDLAFEGSMACNRKVELRPLLG